MMSRIEDGDIASRILATEQVRVSWIENAEGYLYEHVDGRIVANSEAASLRFELKEITADSNNFEVVIRKVQESYICKTDCPGNENKTYHPKIYTAPNELLLYAEDDDERVYFHLS